MNNSEPHKLGKWRVDPGACQLDDGRSVVRIEPRAMAVLSYLAAHPGRTVSRNELLDHIWQTRYVVDEALTKCISQLRRALQDDVRRPSYILTIAKLGYRLLVTPVPLSTAPVPVVVSHGAISLSRARAGAVDLCRRGRAYLQLHGSRSQRYALEIFKRAVAVDPDSSQAWAGLAMAQVSHYLWPQTTEEHRRFAAQASDRAIALDPYSAAAYVARANVSAACGDHAAADVAFGHAQALDAQLFDAWYHHGRSCTSRGEHERAISLYDRAARARVGDYRAPALVYMACKSLGLSVDARAYAQRSVAAAEDMLAVAPDNVDALSIVPCMLHFLNRGNEVHGWLQRALALEPDEPFVNYRAACAYAINGDTSRALSFLERVPMVAERRRWIANDPDFDQLRPQPRFRALLISADSQNQ